MGVWGWPGFVFGVFVLFCFYYFTVGFANFLFFIIYSCCFSFLKQILVGINGAYHIIMGISHGISRGGI